MPTRSPILSVTESNESLRARHAVPCALWVREVAGFDGYVVRAVCRSAAEAVDWEVPRGLVEVGENCGVEVEV